VDRAGTLRRPRSPLHDGTLFQPRRPAFWAYVAIIVATTFVLFGEQSALRGISPIGWTLSWGLLVLYALPVLVLVYTLDLYEREPLSLVIGALVWGAVAATTLAGFANDGWGLVIARVGGPEFAARWTAALTAPFVEEILKGCGVVLIYLIAPDEIDDMMDGFVYGAVCGLGFAVVEDVFYFMGVFGGHPADVLQGFFVRVVASGLYSHVLYTGLVGMGIGYFVSRRERRPLGRRIAVVAGLAAAAVIGHFLWNSPFLDLFPARPWTGADWLMIPVATGVKGLPLLGCVGLAVVLARRQERAWLRGALASEIGAVGVSVGELAILERPARRREAVRIMRRRAGTRAAGLLRRLQREQVNLAMIRSKVAEADDPALLEQRAYCGSLRDSLRAIPGAAPADAEAPTADAGPGGG
jgi:RsiW-degrading membrane proteinase PrsW (M82 family)